VRGGCHITWDAFDEDLHLRSIRKDPRSVLKSARIRKDPRSVLKSARIREHPRSVFNPSKPAKIRVPFTIRVDSRKSAFRPSIRENPRLCYDSLMSASTRGFAVTAI
jgi:hypothetical protein